ncbi:MULTISPECIES: 4-hydroxyphenylpyruvate dioxygenase family protein [Kitasatospora]|uniref:4-hydroxyphenylpyruvate dioxygenase family protein n=1 Tax=Kitasatospora TaxID=2063 RepID=UPI000C27163D|nr:MULTISPECIES: VOC family protein [Kitasatospora]PJN29773.1 4-hydroxyphenylpyruvate dioxygenase [Kitasatospora sp. CB02891]GGQ69142.1 4-hydroxyphenylpyruvate dioxygenase [Kitasatospora griseola]
MTVAGIAYLELYAEDAHKYAAQLRDDWGFTLSSPARNSPGTVQVLAHQGSIRLLVTSAVDAEHQVTEWVRRHGDGVAVIALRHTDGVAAAVAAERALNAGGGCLDGAGTVSGFGDLAVRFADAQDLLPDGELPGPGGLLSLDHVAIVVPGGQLDASVEWAVRGLGFREIFREYIEVGAQAMDSRVVQSPCGSVTFTLLEPDTSRSAGQIDGFLEAHGGAGVQHVAFSTASITASVRELSDRGVAFLSTPGAYYRALEARLGPTGIPVADLRDTNVLVDRDHGGELFQIFARSTHPRRTFFLELVERRGAGSFGTANIKALYEAVERERAVTADH